MKQARKEETIRLQYRAIALVTISLVLIAAAGTNAAVYAAEPTIKQGRQIIRSGDNPIIITGPISPGPSGGLPPGCVEPLGCPPPPRDNAKVSIPNLKIQTAEPLPSEEQDQQQLQVQQPGQQVVTPPPDEPDKPDDKKTDSQQEQEKDDGNN